MCAINLYVFTRHCLLSTEDFIKLEGHGPTASFSSDASFHQKIETSLFKSRMVKKYWHLDDCQGGLCVATGRKTWCETHRSMWFTMVATMGFQSKKNCFIIHFVLLFCIKCIRVTGNTNFCTHFLLLNHWHTSIRVNIHATARNIEQMNSQRRDQRLQ